MGALDDPRDQVPGVDRPTTRALGPPRAHPPEGPDGLAALFMALVFAASATFAFSLLMRLLSRMPFTGGAPDGGSEIPLVSALVFVAVAVALALAMQRILLRRSVPAVVATLAYNLGFTLILLGPILLATGIIGFAFAFQLSLLLTPVTFPLTLGSIALARWGRRRIHGVLLGPT